MSISRRKIRLRHWVVGLCLLLAATSGSRGVVVGAADPTADTIRLLEQATWGPTEGLVQRVQSLGPTSFLNEQFATPATPLPVPTPAPASSSVGCPTGSPSSCFRDNYTQYPNQVAFFKNAMTEPDQLRQRVAFALHQILVVSGLKIQQPSSMAVYYNLLLNDAFGNYRQILTDLTLNPAMGHYLDMVNNDKASADGRIQPNENYAREILQLFSIGLYWLNSDGSLMKSGNQPIPTYDQDTIEGFAHAFTGWTYSLPGGGQPTRFPNGTANFIDRMIQFRDAKTKADTHHDKGAKELLSLSPNGKPVTLPANQDADLDLKAALDNIFNHPNVGPFIGKQLIQHLVTSNPSAAYVSRVTAAFNSGHSHGFGTTGRGDLKAVIAAILLDDEARGAVKTTASYGRLREPVQFVLNVCRAFDATSDGILNDQSKAMGQDLFYSPSVFNYYPHEFQAPGTTLQGPEFGLESSAAALTHENFANTMVFGHIQPPSPATGTKLDLSQLVTLAANPAALLDQLNSLLLHGTMSATMRTTVLNAVLAVPANNPTLRAQTALYLVLASGAFQVER